MSDERLEQVKKLACHLCERHHGSGCIETKIDPDFWICKGWLERANALYQEQPKEQPERPKIVCLCGSTRFVDAFMSEYARLSQEGNIVLTVSKLIPQHDDIEPKLDQMRKWLHFRKIDLADEVLILNVGGYIGESTKGELEYAKQHRKTIRFLEPAS